MTRGHDFATFSPDSEIWSKKQLADVESYHREKCGDVTLLLAGTIEALEGPLEE